jgi:hypothetical protein
VEDLTTKKGAMFVMRILPTCCIILASIASGNAFLINGSARHRWIFSRPTTLATIPRSQDGDVQPKVEYGVSYIGGDPCGSKYNDDPFDRKMQRPGMPDDMKARIQALADKKVAEEEKAAATRCAENDQ